MASGNDKLIAHLMTVLGQKGVMSEWVPCLSHQGHHLQGYMLGFIGFGILDKLYGCCHLLRVSGKFNRLRMAVRPWLGSVVRGRIRLGSPPSRSQQLAACILSYFEDNEMFLGSLRRGRRTATWKHSLKSELRAQPGQSTPATAFIGSLRSLLADWALVVDDQQFVHVCCGPNCCPSGEASLIERIRTIRTNILATVLKSCPSPPAASKWTKLGPVLDATMLGICFGMWPGLFKTAFGNLAFACEVSNVGGGRTEEAADEQHEFQALQGKRYRAALALHESQDARIRIVLLAIVLEPVRFLLKTFFRWSHKLPRPSCAAARVHTDGARAQPGFRCNAVPIGVGVRTSAARCARTLVCLLCGHDSMQAFLQNDPDIAHAFARAALLCMAWVWRKIRRRFEDFPFKLFRLTDARCPASDKDRLCREWDSARPCCLRPSMAASMKRSGITSADLMGPDWHKVLRSAASVLRLTVADIELRRLAWKCKRWRSLPVLVWLASCAMRGLGVPV